jgi:hypothetical protein
MHLLYAPSVSWKEPWMQSLAHVLMIKMSKTLDTCCPVTCDCDFWPADILLSLWLFSSCSTGITFICCGMLCRRRFVLLTCWVKWLNRLNHINVRRKHSFFVVVRFLGYPSSWCTSAYI